MVPVFVHPRGSWGFQWKTRPLHSTPGGGRGLKTRLFEGPKSIGSLWVGTVCPLACFSPLSQDSLGWKRWYSEEKAENADLPRSARDLTQFQRLFLLRVMRQDRPDARGVLCYAREPNRTELKVLSCWLFCQVWYVNYPLTKGGRPAVWGH